jgi:N-acetylmuramoyl-L-alanine amidase-like protein
MGHEGSFGGMDRREFLRLGGAGLAGAVLLGTAGGRVFAQAGSSLEAELESAAGEYGVPRELLLAMGFVNTEWEMPPPDASVYALGDPSGHGVYGVMHLRRNPWSNTLERAASLTRLSEEQLKRERAANVRGGAAVLAEIQGQDRPSGPDGWQETVAEYASTELYAQEVYGTLREGAVATTSTGETLELSPQDVEVPQVFTTEEIAAEDYRRARWVPAHPSNYGDSRRERSYDINKIVIHVGQAGYADIISHFQRRGQQASAHYVISRDGDITQMVRHRDVAWHAGWLPTNKRSIGIEHAGYVSDDFPGAMYRASARLAAYISKRHRVPLDRKHIIGHNQVPGCGNPGGGGVSCHTDPGRYWNWARYMRLIKRFR